MHVADAKTLLQELARFQHDPLGYVLFAFPWGQPGELERETGPRKWQREILEAVGEGVKRGRDIGEVVQIAVASGHGIGKSALVAWLIRWAIATHEDARVLVTANTEQQLRTKTWPEVAKWDRLAIDRHLFEMTATSIFSKDKDHERTWRADAVTWSENNTEAFAGLHNAGNRILVVFDEASAIHDKVWEVTEGALTDANTEIAWCVFGNPTVATGRFRECFRKYRHRWKTWQIDSRTVEGINKAHIEKWVEDHDEDSDFIKIRVRGIFPSMSAKQFISEADVDAAWGRHLRPEQYQFAPVIISCDPAWEGDDELVIAKRQGLAFSILKTMGKNDNDMVVAKLLADYEDEHRADAVVIDAGYGTGIASIGRTWNRKWHLVWFGSAPNDPGCVNKRAEIWKEMRDWLKAGGSIPKDQALRDDLLGPEIVARADGKLCIEPKDAMKKRGLQSPNRADALALTFAVNVRAKSDLERMQERIDARRRLARIEAGHTPYDYDPLEVR